MFFFLIPERVILRGILNKVNRLLGNSGVQNTIINPKMKGFAQTRLILYPEIRLTLALPSIS
ncbi:hypothetical protein ADICYQ_0970 [Cyclobacterium qasimii M12-11B]|uniref:Uncharacterized protein n=1 Tax=Cyclobacterium qasimii M12-11B TaxID=641524 RepID=S7VKS5_9BACT|nr:hypothetical protein ADICYQ_0970 [Cyclobacterium qasimii M12-11B]